MTASLITKARTTELKSSEIAPCLREIERLNGAWARLEIHSAYGPAIHLGHRFHRLAPSFYGKSVEEVLIAAYDHLMRIAVDEQMDGLGCEAAE